MKDLYDTERLILRRACDKDLNDLYTILGDPIVMGKNVKTYDATLKLMNDAIKSKNAWVVILKENRRVVCYVEVNETKKDEFVINEYFNLTFNTKGYMYEVARTFAKELFDGGAKKVSGIINYEAISGEKLNDRLNYKGVVNNGDSLIKK